MLLLPLIRFASAASFVPVKKQNYSMFDSGWRFRENLEKAVDFPVAVLESGLPPVLAAYECMDDAMLKGTTVSESFALWAMRLVSCPIQRSTFLHHVMDKYGYISVIKDLVDMESFSYISVENNRNPANDKLFIEYLTKHGLDQFPYLPASLRTAIWKVSSDGLNAVHHHLKAVISDYTHWHPAKMIYPTSLQPAFKVMLLCYCLDGVHFNSALLRPMQWDDLAAMDEVSREFPDKMAPLLAGMKGKYQVALELYRSGQPPKDDFWYSHVEEVNSSFDLRQYFDDNPLFHEAIHYSFKNHPAWMQMHWLDLKPDARLVYFFHHPQDTIALPKEMPSLNLIIPNRLSPRLLPFYQAMIKEYGRPLIRGALRKRVLGQMILISSFEFQDALADRSFNKIFFTLYHKLGLNSPGFRDILAYFLLKSDPTKWATFLINA